MNQMMYEIARVLQKTCAGKKPKDVEEVVSTALTFLKRHRVPLSMAELADALERIDEQQRGVTRATVTSRYPLPSGVQRSLSDYVRTRIGTDVTLIEQTDQNVTGGFRIRYGSTLIDATADALLQQLSLHLINQE